MRWSCQRKCCHRRHPSIKGIFVSSPPLRLSPLPCLITLLVCCCCCCHCQGLDVATLLACVEPSFDTVPWRLRCVVLMGCWRLVCGGQWDRIKKRGAMWPVCAWKTPSNMGLGCVCVLACFGNSQAFHFPAGDCTQLSHLRYNSSVLTGS